MPRALLLGSILSVLTATAGCGSLGPSSIPRDRFDYNRAIADSWKRQALLNIVKVRYLDVPIWLEVGQVVSGYSLETSVSVGGQLSSASAVQGDSASMGAAARFTDRPTITYAPMTGDRFLEAFLTPIPPDKIFALIQSGYAADFIIELGLDSLSGLRNHPSRIGTTTAADPEFFRAAALMREVQDAAAVGMQVEKNAEGELAMSLYFRAERVSPEILAKVEELRQLLQLSKDLVHIPLVYSPLYGGEHTLSVGTRSLMQLLGALAIGVEIPAEHRERAMTPPMAATDAERPPLLAIRSGSSPPGRTFVATEYEGAWFWIEEGDWRSKRTFTSLLFLFSLASAGSGEAPPTITIPAQ